MFPLFQLFSAFFPEVVFNFNISQYISDYHNGDGLEGEDYQIRSVRLYERSKSEFVNAGFVGDNGQVKVPVTPDVEVIADEDPWDTVKIKRDEGPSWSELSLKHKIWRVCLNCFKGVMLLGLLYMFICSLDLLGLAFRLIVGNAAGDALNEDSVLSNPIGGLMIGVIITVILQSSSTTTSIIVTMVGATIIDVQPAIFIIMGANIGTSVTSTIVAMSQVGDRQTFRRAFAGGTVHDMFNWLTVLVLLPIEWASGYLFVLTKKITDTMGDTNTLSDSPQFLQAITKPFVDVIVKVKQTKPKPGSTTFGFEMITEVSDPKCAHLFCTTALLDWEVGLILVFVSIVVISTSLILLVKILSSIMHGSVAKIIRKVVDYDLPYPFKFLTGYIAIFVGAGLTVLIQSSSVFTSTLTPLVGLGIISLKRMFPLTLGSNIGTTATSILAALAATSNFRASFQTSLAHLFFNVTGVMLWYVLPVMRRVPIGAAKFLGRTTAKYRWFAIAYIITVFLLFPGFVFGLSYAGWIYLAAIGGPLFLLFMFVIVVNILRKKAPFLLPSFLKSWKWLPLPFRSLAPMDSLIRRATRFTHCCRCLVAKEDEVPDEVEEVTNIQPQLKPTETEHMEVINMERLDSNVPTYSTVSPGSQHT